MHIVYTNGGCSVVHPERRTKNVYSREPENVRICVCHPQYAYANGGCSVVHVEKRTTNIYAHVSRKMYAFLYVTSNMHNSYSNGGCSVVHTAKKTIVHKALLLRVNICTCKYMSKKIYLCVTCPSRVLHSTRCMHMHKAHYIGCFVSMRICRSDALNMCSAHVHHFGICTYAGVMSDVAPVLSGEYGSQIYYVYACS